MRLLPLEFGELQYTLMVHRTIILLQCAWATNMWVRTSRQSFHAVQCQLHNRQKTQSRAMGGENQCLASLMFVCIREQSKVSVIPCDQRIVVQGTHLVSIAAVGSTQCTPE